MVGVGLPFYGVVRLIWVLRPPGQPVLMHGGQRPTHRRIDVPCFLTIWVG
jgi:hypothetical protein